WARASRNRQTHRKRVRKSVGPARRVRVQVPFSAPSTKVVEPLFLAEADADVSPDFWSNFDAAFLQDGDHTAKWITGGWRLIHLQSPRDGLFGNLSLRCHYLLFKGVCGFANHVEHEVGLGEHRNVAAIGLEGLRSHALCDETFQVGLDGMVTGSNDVPARFGFPSCSFDLLIEEVCRRRCMRGPNELLLFFR